MKPSLLKSGVGARAAQKSHSNPQDEKDRARALAGEDVAASPGVAKGMQKEPSLKGKRARK